MSPITPHLDGIPMAGSLDTYSCFKPSANDTDSIIFLLITLTGNQISSSFENLGHLIHIARERERENKNYGFSDTVTSKRETFNVRIKKKKDLAYCTLK